LRQNITDFLSQGNNDIVMDLYYKLKLLDDSLNKLHVSLREIDYLKTKLNIFLILRVIFNSLV